MRWDEVDLDAKVWTIPAAKSKNGKPMKIPLVQAVIDLLTARKNNGGGRQREGYPEIWRTYSHR
jgi:integrase